MKCYSTSGNPVYIEESEIASIQLQELLCDPGDRHNDKMYKRLIVMLKGNSRFILIRPEQWILDNYDLNIQ